MSDYSVTRSITIDAPAERILPHLVAFPAWRSWSPWEGADPDLVREYRGASFGVGAEYEYRGRKSGNGVMRITAADDHGVSVHLQFLKPFRSESDHRFELTPAGGGATTVAWTMSGRQNAMMKLMFPVEKFIGRDFDKGLAQLKRAAEETAPGIS